MHVRVKVLRFNPERDTQPEWRDYLVTAESADRVLDVLHEVKWRHDGINVTKAIGEVKQQLVKNARRPSTGGHHAPNHDDEIG